MEKKIKIIVHSQDKVVQEDALLASGWRLTLKGAPLGDRWEKDAIWHNVNDQTETQKLFSAALMSFCEASARNKPNIQVAITEKVS